MDMISRQFLSSLVLATLAWPWGAAAAMDYTCTPGVEPSPGVSLPRGDISLAVDGPPQILTCHLNPEHEYYRRFGLRAKDLSFWMAGNTTLPATLLNETTIRDI
jgi:hypothetical protein